MTQTAAPKVPWIIAFQHKDLLTACWGSKKGADLLYHFLHKASWERKNQNLPETLKDIKFQESTPKALEKSGLSLGSFHTYLKHFVSVGYISTEAYTGEYTIHINAIEQAFTKAPEKPVSEACKRRQPRAESFKLKDCNFVTLAREDYEMLMELKDECFKLKEMFQSLKHSHAQMLAELKEMFQSLKQNPTIDTAQEADAEAFSEPQSNALRDIESNDLEREDREGADAPTPTPSQDEPYRPDYSLPALEIKELSPVLDEAIERVDEARTALDTTSQEMDFVEAREYLVSIGYKLEPTPQAYRCEVPGKALWSVTLPDYPNGFETWTTTEIKQHAARIKATPPSSQGKAEFSTSQVVSPQRGAKVEPAKPKQGNSSSKGVTLKEKHVPPTAQLKPQLTLLGGQVREWYEIIRATRLRLIANNVKALNELGELDGMSFENLKETIELIEDQDLVKKKSIPIGLQELASEEGYWRFDKWYPVVQRNRQQQASRAQKQPTNIVTVPKDSGMVLWHDKAGAQRMMSYAEADENGWEGGFGEFIQHTQYGRTSTV